MVSTIVQYALILAVSWAAWRGFRRAVVKSPSRNLAGPPRLSWFAGNMVQIFNPKGEKFQQDTVKRYGGAVKIHGIAGDEQVYFSDPRALHYIVVKDQEKFEETAMFTEMNRIAVGDGLLSSNGIRHKRQRKILNPVFSASHMRSLTPLFYDIADQSHRFLADKLEGGQKVVDMLDVLTRTALEFIGQGGLGYSFDVLEEGTTNAYGDSARNFLPTVAGYRNQFMFLPILVKIGSPAFRRFVVNCIPLESVRKLKGIIDVMDKTSTGILDDKKAALAQGDEAMLKKIGQGKDIMSVLLRANMNASEDDRLPEKEILGQMSTLIFAAQDTTSSAMSRILHMLCEHPEAQERVRQEVTEARALNGNLSYDDIIGLPYLDAVCRETLRLHAPASTQSRTANQATVVPLLRPVTGTDGRLIHEVPIARGQNVLIGITAANRDVEIWGQDAAEWKPERWLEPLPESVVSAHVPGIYSNMMTFLGGARACIGFKFAQLEMKIVISMFLEKFRFSLPDEKVVWNLGILMTPSLEGKELDPPHLPLKVSLV